MGRIAQHGFPSNLNHNDTEIAHRTLGDAGITELSARTFGELGGGQKQMALTARGLRKALPFY